MLLIRFRWISMAGRHPEKGCPGECVCLWWNLDWQSTCHHSSPLCQNVSALPHWSAPLKANGHEECQTLKNGYRMCNEIRKWGTLKGQELYNVTLESLYRLNFNQLFYLLNQSLSVTNVRPHTAQNWKLTINVIRQDVKGSSRSLFYGEIPLEDWKNENTSVCMAGLWDWHPDFKICVIQSRSIIAIYYIKPILMFAC